MDQLINALIAYKNDDLENKGRLINYFSKSYLIHIMDKQKLIEFEKKFKVLGDKGVDICDFLKIFITTIEHKEDETLYLVLCIIDFFKDISEANNMIKYIKYSQFTSYVCEVFYLNFLLLKKYYVNKEITTY